MNAGQMRAPDALRNAVASLEHNAQLDRLADAVGAFARRVNDGRRGAVLRGEWLGHALHPLLTDLPLGCWLASGVLDLGLKPRFRPASQRLVGLGVLASIPTALSGHADYAGIDDPRSRRVGAVHAVGNGGVVLAYLMSWRSRRRGHHWRGVAWGLLGGAGGWATGYLGGHLSFARRVGTGERGLQSDESPMYVHDVLMETATVTEGPGGGTVSIRTGGSSGGSVGSQ